MLAKNFRLRRRRDFAYLHRQGRSAHVPVLSLKTVPNRLPHPRTAVVVSTKVSKKAVVRNRIRRRLLGILAEIWPLLKPADIVIFARLEAHDCPSLELKKQLLGCLEHLKLLHLDEE